MCDINLINFKPTGCKGGCNITTARVLNRVHALAKRCAINYELCIFANKVINYILFCALDKFCMCCARLGRDT